jgi:cbb3-type cytochrome oxidase cytochrome c subunit
MTSIRKFIALIALTFALPWLALIMVPALMAQKLVPLKYDKDKDGRDGVYPGKPIYRQGQLVYAREGCVQCHTQMIRPSYWGIIDQWKKGWGSDQTDAPAQPTRTSSPYDFMSEPFAYLGIARIGPDLANAGYRLEKMSRAEIHGHLYQPASSNAWSIMPSFRHLYKITKDEGGAVKVKVSGEFAPPAGQAIVPTQDAEVLVDYLLSLKNDSPLPGTVVSADAAPAKK